MRKHVLGSMLLCSAALVIGSGSAFADSEFIEGRFTEIDPAGQSHHDRGVCAFITGPREDLAPDQFVLTIGDSHSPNEVAVRLTGTFSASAFDATGQREFTLHPDPAAAAKSFEGVLRQQLADKWADFRLDELQTRVKQVLGKGLSCHVLMTGRVSGTAGPSAPVSVSFVRHGQYFPGASDPSAPAGQVSVPGVPIASATATAKGAAPSCPLDQLAPWGLAPAPDKCDSSQCLLNFKGYRWWTSYQYTNYGGKNPSFKNDGLQTVFAPKNVSVDGQGLHLKMSRQDVGGGPVPTGAEAVLMFKGPSGTTEANLGYGDYLVTATVKTANSWALLDPNAAFGVFTYERLGAGSTGPSGTNPNRELDLAELSRWGWDHTGNCTLKPSALCEGNAQFTLQPWEADDNLKRYTIMNGKKTVTLVMTWQGANKPVTFREYDGAWTFANLPAEPDNQWPPNGMTSAAQNIYVPATNCERFHLNFWFGNYSAGKNPNPPPSQLPQEVVVTNFQFKPFKP